MKKEQLKQIIKEELQAMLNEMDENEKKCKRLEQEYDAAYADGIANPGRGYSAKDMDAISRDAERLGCKWQRTMSIRRSARL